MHKPFYCFVVFRVYARCYVYLKRVHQSKIDIYILTAKFVPYFARMHTYYIRTRSICVDCRTASPNRFVQAIKRCIVKWKTKNKYAKFMWISSSSIVLCNHKIWWPAPVKKNDTGQIYRFCDGHMIKNYDFFQHEN